MKSIIFANAPPRTGKYVVRVSRAAVPNAKALSSRVALTMSPATSADLRFNASMLAVARAMCDAMKAPDRPTKIAVIGLATAAWISVSFKATTLSSKLSKVLDESRMESLDSSFALAIDEEKNSTAAIKEPMRIFEEVIWATNRTIREELEAAALLMLLNSGTIAFV